jgi:hypothetical protein
MSRFDYLLVFPRSKVVLIHLSINIRILYNFNKIIFQLSQIMKTMISQLQMMNQIILTFLVFLLILYFYHFFPIF